MYKSRPTHFPFDGCLGGSKLLNSFNPLKLSGLVAANSATPFPRRELWVLRHEVHPSKRPNVECDRPSCLRVFAFLLHIDLCCCRCRLLDSLGELGHSLAVVGATVSQLSVMLEAAFAHDLLATRILEQDIPVGICIGPVSLRLVVLELDRISSRGQVVDDRLDTIGVVVPPSSVHIGSVY